MNGVKVDFQSGIYRYRYRPDTGNGSIRKRYPDIRLKRNAGDRFADLVFQRVRVFVDWLAALLQQ